MEFYAHTEGLESIDELKYVLKKLIDEIETKESKFIKSEKHKEKAWILTDILALSTNIVPTTLTRKFVRASQLFFIKE